MEKNKAINQTWRCHYNYVLNFLISSCLLLSGCGFQLRGLSERPAWLNNISIIAQNVDPDWELVLRKQLQLMHLSIQDDPSLATYWLMLDKERLEKDILSISSGSSSRQYQLNQYIYFSFKSAKGLDLMLPSSIVVSRVITMNNDRILGSHDEEEQLKHNMRQDAAAQLLSRITKTAKPISPLTKQGTMP